MSAALTIVGVLAYFVVGMLAARVTYRFMNPRNFSADHEDALVAAGLAVFLWPIFGLGALVSRAFVKWVTS